jgi:hypothetical protein
MQMTASCREITAIKLNQQLAVIIEIVNITDKTAPFMENHTGSRLVILSNVRIIIAFNFLRLDLIMADIAETIFV